MKVSIVIPTYNRRQAVSQCLRAIVGQSYPDYEVIVVDDGSFDGTANLVSSEFPQVRCLRQERNRGPASARNAGIQAATGDIVAFTDDDCVPPVDWLERLVEGYSRYPKAAGVGGYLEASAEVLARNVLAQYERYVTQVNYRAGIQEYFGGFETPAGGTSNMSYRKAVLAEVGGFDETFPFAGGEDADLKWRVCLAGHRLLYVPLQVLHLRDYCWPAFRRQSIQRGRGSVHFDRKHHKSPSRLRLLLRLSKRGLLTFPDLLRIGPRLAWVKLWAGSYECWGQWLETARLGSE